MIYKITEKTAKHPTFSKNADDVAYALTLHSVITDPGVSWHCSILYVERFIFDMYDVNQEIELSIFAARVPAAESICGAEPLAIDITKDDIPW